MMEGLIITVFISHIAVSSSFLLGSTTSPAVPTSHNAVQFLDLLLDEKHSRSLLELTVNNLQAELAAHRRDTEEQSNKTEMEIEGLKLSLSKEKSNRRQLKQEYTRLSIEFRNISLSHDEVIMRNKELEEKVHNLSLSNDAMMSRENYVEKHIYNLTKELGQDQMRLSNLENKSMAINQSLQLSVSAIQSEIQNHYAELLTLKQKQGYKSGFTVRDPVDGPVAGTITFRNITSNIGNHFNSTSGKFTCVYPGMYFFTMSLYQALTSYDAHCFIRINSGQWMYVFSSTGPYRGYFQSSNSGVIHLNRGDTVDLGRCSAASTMDWMSIFTGFLLSSD